MQAGLESILQQLVEKQRKTRKVNTQNTSTQHLLFFHISSWTEK